MFDVKKKLRELARFGARDGTRQAAEADLAVLKNQEKIDKLLKNEAFQKLLDGIRSDFLKQLDKLVEEDPKLSAYKSLFAKLIGSEKAEEEIANNLRQFVDG